MTGEERLRRTLAGLRPPAPPDCPPLDVEPTSPWEVMIAERLEAIRSDIDLLQARLWWLFALIIGAMVLNLIAGIVR